MCRNNRLITHCLSAALTLAVASVWLAGCAETKQPWRSAPLGKEVAGSGFLGGLYPMQHEGEKGEALLVYRNPKIENREVFAQYTKVLLEPVASSIPPPVRPTT
jgi:hypothetical protein